MDIQIIITNEDGDTLFQDTTSSFEIAQQILGKAENYINKLQVQAENAMEAQAEEEALLKEEEKMKHFKDMQVKKIEWQHRHAFALVILLSALILAILQ